MGIITMQIRLLYILASGLLLGSWGVNCLATDIHFPIETIIQWQHKIFADQTSYSIIYDEQIQQNVILSQSTNSASGMLHKTHIDLHKTPWLNWAWRIEQFPTVDDEQEKSGDDFAARIYIIVSDGWTFLSNKSISYIWSQQAAQDTAWPNPFAGKKVMMLAVQSGIQKNIWIKEKQNVRADLHRLFGKDFKYINAIAIMTDSDNTNSSAKSYYSGIHFSED